MLKRVLKFLSFYRQAQTVKQVKDVFLSELLLHAVEKSYANSIFFQKLIEYKKTVERSKVEFQVTNLGAKTKITDLNKRTIGNFAKKSSSGKRILTFFYNLSFWFKPQNFLELGAGLGFCSSAVALAYPTCEVTSVEGNGALAPFTKKTFSDLGVEVNVLIDDITDLLSEFKKERFNMVFNDGNHTYEFSLKYWNELKHSLSEKSIFIMDDIRWSDGMERAWKTIQNDPLVDASIDLFTLGILVVNPDITPKQHWKIVPTIYKPWK